MKATIRHVAKEAGVSVSTASRALNNKDDVSPETRQRVLDAAEKLRYIPSSIARGLVSGKTRTLGVVVNDNASPVYAEALRGIEEVANQAGFGVLICNSADSPEQEQHCLNILRANHVEGILISPCRTDEKIARRLKASGETFVFIVRHCPGIEADYVITDGVEGGYLVTDYLLTLGHRRVGLVTGPLGISTAEGRLAGYVKALDKHGLYYDEQLVSRGAYTVTGGYKAARQLLDRSDRPSAIFAATDYQAVGVLKAARELAIRVPHDLALAGGDDIELAEFLQVPLTTFDSPSRQIGARAAEILIGRLKGECQDLQQIAFKPRLIVRESSGDSV
jgi:LacI family transcriptional regulator